MGGEQAVDVVPLVATAMAGKMRMEQLADAELAYRLQRMPEQSALIVRALKKKPMSLGM